ncbi:hypothetical protein [Geomonas azotofigens]|uniref:hypothetical protein n=1 Tax=Geomonas azotofigens TaxID=2843196 RepID=UPI001F1C2DA1|nr:hypothetical protein [Geomonas azotofigens]
MIKPKSGSSFLIPSIGDFLFISVFLLMTVHSGKNLLGDGDTGYHVRAGEYMLKTHAIPRYDMFSYLSPPLPWTAHEWLSEVVMAVIHGFSGLTGVVTFYAFLIALTFYLLFKVVDATLDNIIISIPLVVLTTAASCMHWLARPHIISMLFMVIWHRLLDRFQYEGRQKGLYLLPVIMLLWVNLHGGFMGGFMLLGVYLLGNGLDLVLKKEGERRPSLAKLRALGVATALCLVVTLVNPYGFHILLFPFQLTSSKDLMDTVSEFLSPNFHESYVRWFEVYLLGLVATLGFSKVKLNFIEAALVVLFLYMALFSARYIPLFVIVVTPIWGKHLDQMLKGSDLKLASFLKTRSRNIAAIDARSYGHLWPAVAVCAVLAAIYAGTIEFAFSPEVKPVAAIDFLKRERISGNMFNNDEFGDCVIYSAAPMYKVFIDGRLDMYGATRVKEYKKVTNFQLGWEGVLDKYRISWVFFDANSPFSRYLQANPGWKLIYADKVANIFVRNVPQYQYLIRKYPSVRPVPQSDKDDKA